MWPIQRVQRGVCVLAIAIAYPCSGEAVAPTPIEERAIATLTVPGYADFLVADGASVWATNEGRVEKLSHEHAFPVASVPVPEPCGAMAIGFGALWVADCRSRSIYRIDTTSNKVIAIIATGLADPDGELSLAVGAGSVWVLTDANGTLSRIDPATNSVTARIPVAPHSFAAAYGFDAVWITNTGPPGATDRGAVQRIDPSTNTVTATIAVGPVPRFLAAGEGGVWTLNQGDGTVTRVDPRTNQAIATLRLGVDGSGGDITTGAGRVWVRATKVLLTVVDPAANTVMEVFGPPSGSGAVRVADGLVWISAHDIRKVWVLAPGSH